MPETHYSTCSLCEATCGIVVETEGRRVLKIYGDENDVFSKGYICPKAAALQDLYEDPDRLWEPVKRTSSGWKTISWQEAFDETAAGIRSIQSKYGRNALAFYQGNPSVHSLGIMTLGQLFIRSVRTRNRFSATSADQLPHMLAAQQMFGSQVRLPVPDIDRTNYMVIVGGNPLVSNGSIMTAPGMKSRLIALKERGGTFVVIDPRRTQTAALASEHLFIRPGTDAYLLLALVHTLFEENLVAVGRLEAFVDGLGEMRSLAAETTPESVAEQTGIDAESIRALARGAARASNPVFYGRMGACTQEFGGLTAWLLNVLNILVGALDEPGGAMFANPAVDIPGLAERFGLKGHYDKYRSRVRNLPEFSGELPVATMADEMLHGGEGQIRGLVSIAGNPVLSTPNGTKLEGALEGLEFMVAIDPYINETTKHANIILPPTTALERDHYDVVFSLLMVRNNAKFAPAVFERQPGQRHDWEIFAELWARMQKTSGRVSAAKTSLLKRAVLKAGPRAVLALGLRTGPHKLSLGKLLKTPEGVDLGALKPMMPSILATKDKRIHLVTDPYRQDLARLRAATESDSAYPLRLIGRRHLRSNNSWLHNSERLVKGKDRCTLMVNSADAEALSLNRGDIVTLRSKTGRVRVGVEVTPEMMPGVVSLPHGWGHSRTGTQTRTAESHPGVSMNDLTDDACVDELSGNAVLNGVPVRLDR
jgi:anaerobic selenocysteine-containing dehydrogenase